MARVTVEDCVDKVDSPYELVLVAKERAAQLSSGVEATIERDNDKNTVVALREIAGEKISELALEVSKNKAIKGMGFSSAGPINQLTGEYLNPPNLSEWNKKSLIPIIRKYTGIESKVGHDATLAALAEINFGIIF